MTCKGVMSNAISDWPTVKALNTLMSAWLAFLAEDQTIVDHIRWAVCVEGQASVDLIHSLTRAVNSRDVPLRVYSPADLRLAGSCHVDSLTSSPNARHPGVRREFHGRNTAAVEQ
jgi:hypothetical protein